MDEIDYVMDIAEEFADEYIKARKKFRPMAGRHEGYAVLLEEVEEMWDEIKTNAPTEKVRREAVQVGAMALAIIYDVLRMEQYEE